MTKLGALNGPLICSDNGGPLCGTFTALLLGGPLGGPFTVLLLGGAPWGPFTVLLLGGPLSRDDAAGAPGVWKPMRDRE